MVPPVRPAALPGAPLRTGLPPRLFCRRHPSGSEGICRRNVTCSEGTREGPLEVCGRSAKSLGQQGFPSTAPWPRRRRKGAMEPSNPRRRPTCSSTQKRHPRLRWGVAFAFANTGLRPLAPWLPFRAGRGRVFVDLLAAADGLFQIGVDPLGRPGPIPPGKIPVEGLGVVV